MHTLLLHATLFPTPCRVSPTSFWVQIVGYSLEPCPRVVELQGFTICSQFWYCLQCTSRVSVSLGAFIRHDNQPQAQLRVGLEHDPASLTASKPKLNRLRLNVDSCSYSHRMTCNASVAVQLA
jgi:hypothetical protein